MYAGYILSVLLPVLLGAALAACAVVCLIRRTEGNHDRKSGTGQSDNVASFLFSGDALIDANATGAAMFDGPGWSDFQARFGARFDGLRDADLSQTLRLAAQDDLDRAVLTITPQSRWTRVDLRDDGGAVAQGQRAFDAQAEVLRQAAALDASPYPIWTSNDAGTVLWNNSAYDRLLARIPAHSDAQTSEDGRTLFEIALAEDKAKARNRLALTPGQGDPVLWYDVHSNRVKDHWLHFAIDINAVVNSEIAQRNFVQTLTKTFAHLSIGLAIFDRNRQLALFNPALIDLTALPADFLSLRPDLFSFFDRLRDRRMMPEPKNYSDWREQLTALVTEASHGQYSDTWTLPSGLTYRISGRPHPDGAVAFLFEDISAEISLTRRFRSELELGQNVIDTFDEGIVVFSPLGVLALSNERYDRLWPEIDPNHLNEINILNSSRVWQNGCQPTRVWGDVRDFVSQRGDRKPWRARAERLDGTQLSVRCVPLPGGATLIGINLVASDVAPELAPPKQSEKLQA